MDVNARSGLLSFLNILLCVAFIIVLQLPFLKRTISLLHLDDVVVLNQSISVSNINVSVNVNNNTTTLDLVSYYSGVLQEEQPIGTTPAPSQQVQTITPGKIESHEVPARTQHQQEQEADLLSINEYLEWHREQRSKINNETWSNYKYLILRCLQQDKGTCGGASDRLVMTPYLVWRASQTRRLLFIMWEQPALEEFLVPPKGGLDWRIPYILEEMLPFSQHPIIWIGQLATLSPGDSRRCLDIINPRLKLEGIPRGREPKTFDDIYRSIWDKIFIPTAPVKNLIHMSMDKFGLTPGDYVAAHVRALFLEDKSGDPYEARNAVDCAAKLLPGKPIFFASDSRNVSGFAIEYGKGRVVADINGSDPLHLDRGTNFLAVRDGVSNRSASDYYSVFVELYLLGNARCVTHGIGG